VSYAIAANTLHTEHNDLVVFSAQASDSGKRLDAFLQERLPEYSRSRLQAWIKAERVQVNGVNTRSSYLLRGRESIEVSPAELAPLRAEAEALPLRILYEDADVVVVDKPAGMVVHAGAGHSSGTLVNALLHHFGTLSNVNGALRPGIVHRLDKETSGVLVVARTDQAHQSLAAQFQSREVEKIYRALAHGRMPRAEGRLDSPITRDPVRRTRMTTRLGTGRAALTTYRVREQFDRFSYLEVRISTGRTHQIRVHLASIGHALLGDRLYGAPASSPDIPELERFFLHAHRLSFRSPTRGVRMSVESPLAPELETVLTSLRANAARIDASR
jgi:23S rRNA pseudouridine1911/1915/1917 synthase